MEVISIFGMLSTNALGISNLGSSLLRLALVASVALIGCADDSATLRIEAENVEAESLFVKSLITDERIAALPVQDTSIKIALAMPVPGIVRVTPGDESYLSILSPDVEKIYRIDSAGISAPSSTADSLLTYLWESNNEFIAEHLGEITSGDNPLAVRDLFEGLRTERQEAIVMNRAHLSDVEFEILSYQNDARAYSFLFYHGRLMRNLPADDPFFGFIDSVDNESRWLKTLPHNVLYRYEVEYLNEVGELSDLESFIRYIEHRTDSEDLSDFLKAIYLSEVMSSPAYWERHLALFNTESVKRALAREEGNEYTSIILRAAEPFFSSREGKVAYDFEASDLADRIVRLSDFAGRLVFIDVWATWCVPCIAARPRLVKMAERFEEDDRIAFLAVSVDETIDVWSEFLDGRDEAFPNELIIPAGTRQTFGDRFNVGSIPRYILVDADGLIIDANLPMAVAELEERILLALDE